MRNFSGQEAIEFILITALVFFGALFAVLLFGEKISAFFSPDSTVAQVANNKPAGYDASSGQKYAPDYETMAEEEPLNVGPEPEPSGGDLPFTSDENISLAIKDFNNYIQTSGSSGGTDVIAQYMANISQQLEAQGLKSESNDIKDLANVIHNISFIEKSFEKDAARCANQHDFNKCMKHATNEEFDEPDHFIDDVSSFDDDRDFNQVINDLELGFALKEYADKKDIAKTCERTGSIGCSFVEKYQRVLNNDNIDQGTKNVIKELAYAVALVGEDFATMYNFAHGDFKETQTDFLTGERYSNENLESLIKDGDFCYDDFKSYNASNITNLDAVLTCAAGMKTDSGNECH